MSLPNGAAACPKCGNDRISYFRVAGVTEARCQSPRCRHEYETPDAFAHLKG